jgi:hypothetical protein
MRWVFSIFSILYFNSCLSDVGNVPSLFSILINNSSTSVEYEIGGTVIGLQGSGLILEMNELESLTISSLGNFKFSSKLVSGSQYKINVKQQPSSPTQYCSVANGVNSSIASNISDVTINCGLPRFYVGGNISGLSGTIILQNNGLDSSSFSSNGTYSFSNPMLDLSTFSVTISTQPAGQTCFLVSNIGTISSANVTSVDINCLSVTLPGPLIGGQIVVNNLLPGPISENPVSGPAFANDYVGFRNTTSLTDGNGNSANFNSPLHMTTDGVNLYVADGINHSIRKIVISTRQVSTLVTVPGLSPRGVTTDGVNLYFTGLDNSIRKFHLSSSLLSTVILAGGFNAPRDITTDGSNLYIADTNNNQIKMINLLSSAVTLIAGTGVASSIDDPTGIGGIATFNNPRGLMYMSNSLYVANTAGNNIRKIDLNSNPVKVTTIAGSTSQTVGNLDNAIGINATLNNPTGITRDLNFLFVVDSNSGLIRKISLTPPHAVTTYLGCQGTIPGVIQSGGYSNDLVCNAGEANFHSPFGITTDGVSFFISEQLTHIIRKID